MEKGKIIMNALTTLATLIGSIIFFVVVVVVVVSPATIQRVDSLVDPVNELSRPIAPIAISGDNIYVVWWTDMGTSNNNGELMFRASNDGGRTFGDKVNLSNSSNTDSIDTEIAAEGGNVVVTWWEANQTSIEPLMRVSNDGGATFGPIIKLTGDGAMR
jgi:hypothetical protein